MKRQPVVGHESRARRERRRPAAAGASQTGDAGSRGHQLPEQAARPDQQDDEEQEIGDRKREPGIEEDEQSASATPSRSAAARLPSMLPTPPIITTTSAFMVNSTPIAGLKVRNVLTSVPATATSAPPVAKAIADIAVASTPTRRRDRIDRERPHGGAGARARQPETDRSPNAQATPKASTRLAAKVKPMIVHRGG